MRRGRDRRYAITAPEQRAPEAELEQHRIANPEIAGSRPVGRATTTNYECYMTFNG
jgi:hypothetical protein